MESRVPQLGEIVLYRLSEEDAKAINRRRDDARGHIGWHRNNANGVQIHVGNHTKAGDVFPMIITRLWGDTPESCVNGQVMLDGNDLFWVTSTSVDLTYTNKPRTFDYLADRPIDRVVEKAKGVLAQ